MELYKARNTFVTGPSISGYLQLGAKREAQRVAAALNTAFTLGRKSLRGEYECKHCVGGVLVKACGRRVCWSCGISADLPAPSAPGKE